MRISWKNIHPWQEIHHAPAAGAEEQLPGLVTRLEAQSGAGQESGAPRPVQGELAQCLSPRRPASGQEEYCGPARWQLSKLSAELVLCCLNISLSGGFTKSGNPVLIFPDKAGFSSVSEGDLLILLKYFISVVPRAEQVEKNYLRKLLRFFDLSNVWRLMKFSKVAPGIALLTWLSHQKSLRWIHS